MALTTPGAGTIDLAPQDEAIAQYMIQSIMDVCHPGPAARLTHPVVGILGIHLMLGGHKQDCDANRVDNVMLLPLLL